MRYAIVLLFAVAACAAARAQTSEEPAETRLERVTVTAEGYSRDDAIKQALRMALEKGAGVQIASFSNVENFELIRDTIYTRAFGIVTDYRITAEKPGAGGTVWITIEATVRNSAVAEAWGEVQNVLDQIGRPKMMVVIDEYIDGRLQQDSIVAARIEQMFTKVGFEMVERRGVAELNQREANDAQDERDAAKLARLAKDAGAQILIRGTANADRAGLENLYGVPAAFYNCDVLAKVYWTDTGRLVTSASLPVTRKGVRSRKEFSPQAARAALAAATFPDEADTRRLPALAIRLYESTMENWSTQISAGGEITLEVDNLEFESYVKIRRALGEIERLDSVNGDFTKGQGIFRIKAKIDAATLAELLIETPFKDLLEVTDLKPNRIQARGFSH
ncbi:MAG: hypothetical protein JXO22_15130 [Phycisphaerae bacterium]|nr:hypothetical protein [Phycisphaerae bacterium]